MKKKSSRYRTVRFPTGILGTIDDRHLSASSHLSASRERGGRAKTIFVIRQTRALSATNASRKKIRRVLIFDNHPATLRLLFGRRPDRHVDLFEAQRARSREFVLVWMLAAGLLIAMFWPLL